MDNFVLLLVEPTLVDHLLLRQNERFLYELADGSAWTQKRINP